MSSKKDYLLEAFLSGSALIHVNQDGMLTTLILNNLYSLVSIEENEITFLMENIIVDKDEARLGGKSVSWTFNTEDIYLLSTFDMSAADPIKTTFWMDKYPHKEVIKKNIKNKSFIKNKVLGEDLKNLVPPYMVDKIAELIELLGDAENDTEVFDCDTKEDSDIFFLLESCLLNDKGYLALSDVFVPIAVD